MNGQNIEHIDRLVAARLAADVLNTNLLLVARTDAEAATLLDSNIDSRDHPFILGVTVPGLSSLREVMTNSTNKSAASKQWGEKAKLMTFGEAVLAQITSLDVPNSKKEKMRARWMQSEPNSLSITKSRQIADSIFGRRNSVSFEDQFILKFAHYFSSYTAICQIRFTSTGNYAESEKATTSFGLESVSLTELDIIKDYFQNYWAHFCFVLKQTTVSSVPGPMRHFVTSFGWRPGNLVSEMQKFLVKV